MVGAAKATNATNNNQTELVNTSPEVIRRNWAMKYSSNDFSAESPFMPYIAPSILLMLSKEVERNGTHAVTTARNVRVRATPRPMKELPFCLTPTAPNKERQA